MSPDRRRLPRQHTARPELRILHEDADVVVVDKPPGLLTSVVRAPGESGAGDPPSVFGFLKARTRRARGQTQRLWVVHRLDKEASGLLVFAASERAFNWLKNDFKTKRVHRLYHAVVDGEFPDHRDDAPAAGTVRSFMAEGRDGLMRSVPEAQVIKRQRGSRARVSDDAAPKHATTHYRVVAQAQGRSLLQVRLDTGRKNQIRVHLAESGRPILGDHRYFPHDRVVKDPLGRLCLHASELGFTHPATGAAMRFSSPPPDAFFGIVNTAPPRRVEATLLPTTTRPPGEPLVRAQESDAQGWEHVAPWYEALLAGEKSDHYRDVIIPGTLRLLKARQGERLLDVACGNGVLCEPLLKMGCSYLGVDASETLIDAARRRTSRQGDRARFEVGDARSVGALELGTFDSAACVMALMNIDPIETLLAGVAQALDAGGAFVTVILHPAFRAPGQTSWAWTSVDEDGRRAMRGAKEHGAGAGERVRQFRRVDGYLSVGRHAVVMNPGAAASGAREITTWSHHRPIQTYVKALAESGLLIESIEEWASARTSAAGPRSAEENRARREIPMFLGIRAIKRG